MPSPVAIHFAACSRHGAPPTPRPQHGSLDANTIALAATWPCSDGAATVTRCGAHATQVEFLPASQRVHAGPLRQGH